MFTQIRHLTDSGRRENAEQHTAFFSFGENFGHDAAIPDDGFRWQPTRQPIVLDAWPVVPSPETGCFTTVMQWESYAAREYQGRRFGLKSDSFTPYLDLPARVGPLFEIAVGGRTAPQILSAHGWMVSDPLQAIPDPLGYQQFIQRSKAEFTVAKQGTWRREAAGSASEARRTSQAAVQSSRRTPGSGKLIPSGDGLLPFSTPAEAARAVTDVIERYDHHCRAARALAEAEFDSEQVLQDLLDRAL